MHLPSEVPSPPRCGGKISNGRKQVADIRQGKRVILISFSLLKRIVISLIFTIFCMLQFFASLAAFILRKVFPFNFSQSEKKSWPLCPNQELTTVLAHALIVLPWPSWTGWANQSVCYYGGKLSRLGGWIYHQKKVNERPSQGSPFTSSQPFCSSWHVNGSPSFCKEMYKKLAHPG